MRRLRWRPSERQQKFGRDVGSVVLGVLIALTIGEIVEAVRWRVRAFIALDAIEAEIARNTGVMQERVLIQRCIDRRLNELSGIVRTARRTGQLPLVGPVGRTTSRPIEQAAWMLTSGSETLLHIENPKRDLLAITYSQIAWYDVRVNDELQMWATLSLLENAEGPISDDMLVEIAGTLARLRDAATLNALVAEQIVTAVEDLGIEPSYFLILDREGDAREVAARSSERPICKPLPVGGRVPA